MGSTFATEDNEPNPGWDTQNAVACPACNGTGDIPTDSGCNDCCELCCGEGRVERWVAEKYGSAGDREVLKARPTVASENKGTKGHCWTGECDDATKVYTSCGEPGDEYLLLIADMGTAEGNVEMEEANAKLFVEALEVTNTTGKAPRELAGENAILSARVEVLERERDEARKAILSYGNGADFDWNVLWRIDDLERESGEFRDLIQELEYALTSPSRQFCDVTRDEMAPWVRDAAALLAKHAGEPGGVQ